MTKRFLLLNVLVLVLFSSLILAYNSYYGLKDEAVGDLAQVQLQEKEDNSLDELASLKFSVYSTQTTELNQVRNDIMAQFQESDFASITIQPKASFIDTLLSDSQLKEYMNKSDLKKSNKSLLNKMKLYLPNELLVSFLPSIKAIDQTMAIEEYLQENGYTFLDGKAIPSVKSNIKHYYFDKSLFDKVVDNFSSIAEAKDIIKTKNNALAYQEIIFMFLNLLFVTAFIQLLDYYLLNKNMDKIKFLLKGHIKPKTYYRKIKYLKSVSLIIILLSLVLFSFIDISSFIKINSDIKFISFVGVILITNLMIFFIKKERIEI